MSGPEYVVDPDGSHWLRFGSAQDVLDYIDRKSHDSALRAAFARGAEAMRLEMLRVFVKALGGLEPLTIGDVRALPMPEYRDQ